MGAPHARQVPIEQYEPLAQALPEQHESPARPQRTSPGIVGTSATTPVSTPVSILVSMPVSILASTPVSIPVSISAWTSALVSIAAASVAPSRIVASSPTGYLAPGRKRTSIEAHCPSSPHVCPRSAQSTLTVHVVTVVDAHPCALAAHAADRKTRSSCGLCGTKRNRAVRRSVSSSPESSVVVASTTSVTSSSGAPCSRGTTENDAGSRIPWGPPRVHCRHEGRAPSRWTHARNVIGSASGRLVLTSTSTCVGCARQPASAPAQQSIASRRIRSCGARRWVTMVLRGSNGPSKQWKYRSERR